MESYQTNRLILKVLDDSNSCIVTEYINRNVDFFSDFEPLRDKKFYTENFQKTQLKTDLKFIQDRLMLKLWIFKKEDLNKIIGEITFYNIVPFAFLSCHVGYKLDKDETNKGYMTEALKKGIEIMFNEYGMHRIEAYILEENKSSLNLCKRLNFINEGVAHKFLEVNGEWKDHIRMALINDI